MLKISDYQMLQVLYRSKSITMAARELFISQPALTKRIQQLESDLGITIVKRNVKGIVFTVAGEHLVLYAEKMLMSYKDLRRELQGLQQNEVQTVSIMSAGSLANYLLPDLLRAFKEQYPEAQYALKTAGSNKVVQGIYERHCDVGFIRGEPWLECMREEIQTECATAIYCKEVDLQMLPYLPRIDPEMSESARMFINSWWQNTYDVVPYISARVQNIAICVKLVSAGLGYSIIISKDAYKDAPNIKTMRLKDRAGNYLIRKDYMLYRQGDGYNQITKEFIRFSRAYFLERRSRDLS